DWSKCGIPGIRLHFIAIERKDLLLAVECAAMVFRRSAGISRQSECAKAAIGPILAQYILDASIAQGVLSPADIKASGRDTTARSGWIKESSKSAMESNTWNTS